MQGLKKLLILKIKLFAKLCLPLSSKWRHGVKVEPVPRDLDTLGPGTRDHPQSLKVGPGTPLKFKSGTAGAPSKFKSGTPSPFFNKLIKSFFSEYLIAFFTHFILSFLNTIQKISTVSNRNQQSALKINKYMWQRKNYLKRLNRTPVNLNPTEIITFLDRHLLRILFEVYL